jgi:hypothetical protein
MMKNTGARYEIAIDGKPRSYRDTPEIARGRSLSQHRNPNVEVVIRDLESRATTVIANPPTASR